MMRNDYVLCLGQSGFHRMHFTDWGHPASRQVVVCVHGLTRNCRDFDFLSRSLAARCRVVCPDVVGRGRSDWLVNKGDYGYPQYMTDLNALITRVTAWPVPATWIGKLANFLRRRYGSRPVYWVGTSMGGILGMLLASRPKSPIRKLVMNDVGPLVPRAALERLGRFVGLETRFQSFQELEAYQRKVSAPFGPLTDAQWRHLTLPGARQYEDGTWGVRYDPEIGAPFRQQPLQDVDLWSYWDTIICPTLVLRGAESDLLLRSTAEQMKKRGPRAKVVEFSGIGHAPMLMSEDQIKVVKDFLLAPQ